MRMRLQKAWESRSPRERHALILLAVILSVTLYTWLVTSADQARTRLRSSIPALRVQADELQQHAAEYKRIKATPSVASSTGDLQALVQSQADAAGLSHALNGIDAIGNDQVRLTFQAVPFADWLDWVAAMQLQRIRFEKGQIEALPESGIVTVTGTFIRSTVE